LESVTHPAKDSTSSLERTPRIGMAMYASSGSLHSHSVPFAKLRVLRGRSR
jgi:hypothetical protein